MAKHSERGEVDLAQAVNPLYHVVTYCQLKSKSFGCWRIGESEEASENRPHAFTARQHGPPRRPQRIDGWPLAWEMML